MPLDLRVYGLEGIVDTQDEAITKHALTLARHDERLGASEVTSAVHSEQIGALVKVTATMSTTMNKVMWTLIGSAISVTSAVLVAGLTHPFG
jgi:hypothetical protein